MVAIRFYTSDDASTWDAFVEASRNGTFILQRRYMDYHQDRFDDASIIVCDGGKLLALLPAHRDGDLLHSHRGLTYGGFVFDTAMTTLRMMAVFEALIEFLRSRGFRGLSYAPVPHIYHRGPSEEDCHALFRLGARIENRQVLSVIDMSARLPWQNRRNRQAKRAISSRLTVCQSDDWTAYWRLLEGQLDQRFGGSPVHSLAEIQQLQGELPDNIKLYLCNSESKDIQAGVVIYETARVARSQYIASNDAGRRNGAVDLMFRELLDVQYADKPYFDFGTSAGRDAGGMSRGIIEQKEGFGARTIVHDVYELMFP